LRHVGIEVDSGRAALSFALNGTICELSDYSHDLFMMVSGSSNEMTSQQAPASVVLVVEDEELLRLLAVDLVEDAGFGALQAANADQAIAILEQRPDIALLFTDIHIPGSMDGLKLAHAVRNRWPPIKIIIVSGQVHLSEDDMPTHSRFFRKPYQPEEVVSELISMVN